MWNARVIFLFTQRQCVTYYLMYVGSVRDE
jgi:hypothetical protein